MAAARSAVDDFEAASGGTVTISGFHSVGQALFGPLIRELGASATAPTVQLTDEDVAQSEFPALTARYDLVLAHRMEHSAPWPRHGIRCLTLVRSRWTSRWPQPIRSPRGRPSPRGTWPISPG